MLIVNIDFSYKVYRKLIKNYLNDLKFLINFISVFNKEFVELHLKLSFNDKIDPKDLN